MAHEVLAYARSLTSIPRTEPRIVTRDGDYAIGLSLVADASAAFPTIVKAYKEPLSESAVAFVLFLVGAVTVLLATKHWTSANVAFPLYAAILYSVLCVIIVTKRTLRAHVRNTVDAIESL